MWRLIRHLFSHLSMRGWLFFGVCVAGFVAEILALATDAIGLASQPHGDWLARLATLNAVSTMVAIVALVVVVAALLIVTARRERPRR